MALRLPVSDIGNQTFSTSVNQNPYEFYIYWNERSERFMLEITNTNTGVTTSEEPEQIEPESVMDTDGLGFGDLLLVPLLRTPSYNEEGSYIITYSDIGVNLTLNLVTPDELVELRGSYGSITDFQGL